MIKFIAYRRKKIQEYHRFLQDEGYIPIDVNYSPLSDNYTYRNSNGKVVFVSYRNPFGSESVEWLNDFKLSSLIAIKALGFESKIFSDTEESLTEAQNYLDALNNEINDTDQATEFTRFTKRVLFAFSGKYISPEEFKQTVFRVSNVVRKAYGQNIGSKLLATAHELIKKEVIDAPEKLPTALEILLEKAQEYERIFDKDNYFFWGLICVSLERKVVENMEDLEGLHIKALRFV